jgi:serine/threonine-protein kinase
VAERDRVGQTIDSRLRIDALIGRGAMADVYRAVDLGAPNQPQVAVKVLRKQLLADRSARQRFAREADVQARIRHRNVAALLGSGVTDEDEPYLVVELLRGRSLRGTLKAEARVTSRRAVSYAWQALQGLGAVHAAGVLHRDLKPANIMLEPSPGPVDRVVLIDFGFAALEGGTKLTMQGTVVGSLTYIAPERLRGEEADARSDVYAMGVILFELLTGQPPFVAPDDFDLIAMHLGEAPPHVHAIAPEVVLGPTLEQVLAVALAKRQEHRYASAAAMAAALEAAARELPA